MQTSHLLHRSAHSGPEEKEQTILVHERVPLLLGVRKAEEGSSLYRDFSGPCFSRREGAADILNDSKC